MALNYKQRRRWSLILLLVFLPIYILVAVVIMSVAGRAPIAIEVTIYVILGVGWVFPFKSVFMGIGQADPDAQDDQT
jgi:hypothetical protein